MNTTSHFALAHDTSRLFEPDELMPDQFYATLKRSRSSDPELRLMAAILEDAVSCLAKDPRDCARPHRKSIEEAESWINAEGEEDWVFSFANVCESLGLDPNYLRRGLVRWKITNLSAPSGPLRLKKYRSGPRRKKFRLRAAL
jgi:hypothetical protein